MQVQAQAASSNQIHLARVLAHLPELCVDWPGTTWKWDERFGCALSQFDLADAPQAQEVLRSLLPQEYDEARIFDAPHSIQVAVSRTGWVRAEQLVYVGAPTSRIHPFALWWPWGDGQTISVRVGFSDPREQL
jgi:hypothetical protein